MVNKKPKKGIYLIKNVSGKVQSIQFTRDLMAHELGCFIGFDAGGFMILNKNLLSGITSNFITYLIVLVQFKTSEKSQ